MIPKGGIPREKGSVADRITSTDVEGHAAAVMHKYRIKRDILLIEKAPCQSCGGQTGGVDTKIPNASAMLPSVALLLVVDPSGSTYFRSTH